MITETYNIFSIILLIVSLFVNSYLLWKATNQHISQPNLSIYTGFTFGYNDNSRKVIFTITNTSTSLIYLTSFSIIQPNYGQNILVTQIFNDFDSKIQPNTNLSVWLNYNSFIKIFIQDESRIEWLKSCKKICIELRFSNGLEIKENVPKSIIQDIMFEYACKQKDSK